MARTDPAFRAMVLERRQFGFELWLGLSDYVAACVFAGRSQAGSRCREPLCVDRAGVRTRRDAFRRLVVRPAHPALRAALGETAAVPDRKRRVYRGLTALSAPGESGGRGGGLQRGGVCVR